MQTVGPETSLKAGLEGMEIAIDLVLKAPLVSIFACVCCTLRLHQISMPSAHY